MAGCRRSEPASGPGYYSGPMMGRRLAPAPVRAKNGKLDMDS
jgi:hypothetical protein